jgi:NtrC-family two-component system sensor histidine kinase KinB
MKAIGLRGRFVVAGVLLVATSAASSAWSAWAFRQVGRVVDATVRDSEQTTAATAALATDLEREDDALLLTLADEQRGHPELLDSRSVVESALLRVDALLTLPNERRAGDALRREVEAYHAAGDALVARAHQEGARIRYHEEVNPLLRRAVSDAARIRDDHFRSTQQVAAWARDQAARATQILAGVFGAALLLSLVVAFYLARVVVLPIRELTRAVEGVRKGDFEQRVAVQRADELGTLAEGFNRMADDLAEFRRANIGEVIRARDTLEATLAALPDAVVIVDSQGDVSSANPRASEIMRSAGDERSANVENLPLPEATRATIAAALRGERVALAVDLSKAVTVTVGSQLRKLLPRIVPIEGRGAVLLLSDVTELVRLDEMRMELVAVASHELRTPLTTLRMTLLMLQERASRLEPHDRELVATALLGVEQLSSTVDEFLDLTRIEAGQLRLQRDLVDVPGLLRRTADTVRSASEGGKVAVRLEIGETAPRSIWGDEARLGVVLSNIVSNAIKYTPEGGVIDVVAQPVDAGARLRIAITDSGPGVPPEFRDRVFDKFFRVEHHRHDAEQGVRGSGIGLYIAREVIEAHGGSIECQAGPEGRGARFTMLLPVERVATLYGGT